MHSPRNVVLQRKLVMCRKKLKDIVSPPSIFDRVELKGGRKLLTSITTKKLPLLKQSSPILSRERSPFLNSILSSMLNQDQNAASISRSRSPIFQN